jgi:hypothetical protein
MLRKFKSLLALVVTAMLILSFISACVSGTKTPDSTKDDTKGSEIGDSLIDLVAENQLVIIIEPDFIVFKPQVFITS